MKTIKIKYNEKGKKVSEIPLWNGKLHGVRKKWWSNGRKNIDISYVNGRKNGVYKVWRPCGNLHAITNYNGLRNGISIRPANTHHSIITKL